MNRNRSIKIKAAFLILVFSMNTVIGFACALGLNMGFNAMHHHSEEAMEAVHVHADGNKHIHHQEAGKDDRHKKQTESEDNCCNNDVTKFSQLDKSVPQSITVRNPIFFTAFVSAFYKCDITFFCQNTPKIKYFVRSHHPPIPDIRIAVQSFQI